MTLLQLIQRVRALTRDLTNSIFREQDIVDFINEGINRFKQSIPELGVMPPLVALQEKTKILPNHYHHLLAVYATARCFAQDERHYQATTYMNEFEVKLEQLKSAIEAGEVVIVDENGDEVIADIKVDYVNLRPYHITSGEGQIFRDYDEDEGVEGVGS